MNSYKTKKWLKQFNSSERDKIAKKIIECCDDCKFSHEPVKCRRCPLGEIFNDIVEVNYQEKSEVK